MRRIAGWAMLALVITCLGAGVGLAAIFPQDRGAWPAEWPPELEPLRETSRTIGVGTGIQENIYEIPILDRETFDRSWPALLKVCTPGCRVTLYRVGGPTPKAWGDFVSNQRPAVRVYGPVGGITAPGEIDLKDPPDFEKLIADGRALRAAAPWPKEIVGAKGELPEYVAPEKGKDGRLTWTPADPYHDEKSGARGFYNRARVDIDLVIDGETVDLNRLRFPDGAQVVDRRFDDQK